MHKLTGELFEWELFVQKEFNDFIFLLDRHLFGGSLRSRIIQVESGKKNPDSFRLTKMYIGNGIMWEHEKLDLSYVSEIKILRSANYITYNWIYKDRINLNIVNYFQFNVQRFKDYHLLMDCSLGFKITI